MSNQRKHPKTSPTTLGRRATGQGIVEPQFPAMAIDKGKESTRGAPRYNGGAMPSSLSAGQSSATWVSRPSEELNHKAVGLSYSQFLHFLS